MTASATAEGVPEPPAHLTHVKFHRRRWAKTDATQRRILDAATTVFREHGFTAATIGDVVAASGASIGSIYHHFGGKSELFLAIHERLSSAVGQHITDTGHSASRAAFDTRARGYLDAIWAHRDVAMILAADDVPPGYERIRRDAMQAWFRDWLTHVDATACGALRTRLLIAVLTESAGQVMTCADDREAGEVIDAAVAHLHRLLG